MSYSESITEASKYPETGHDLLAAMHERHFWYRGRRRFVLAALRRALARQAKLQEPLDVADLGGGNGNWLAYLSGYGKLNLRRKLLADSSIRALEHAAQIVGPEVERVQIDLTQPLPWRQAFDVVFALDVIEHFADDESLLEQCRTALRPGGLCVITVPAIPKFWSWNDAAAGHFRRYRLRDLRNLAAGCGMKPLMARYFCFLLSPLYLVARAALRPGSSEKIALSQERLHRVPPPLVNGLLSLIFHCETPLGVAVPFPWGTSAIGIFQT